MGGPTATGAQPPLVLRPAGRRRLRSWIRGVDDRERRLTCPACGWAYTGGTDPARARTLPELTAHDCAAPRERSRGRRPLALLVVLLLAAAAAGVLLTRDSSAPTARQVPTGPPRALLLSGSSLSYDDATRTARALGWDATVYSLPGLGFSRSTLDPAQSLLRSTRELLPAEPPEVLVVQGGEADHSTPRAELTPAVQQLIDEVDRRTGGATQLVLVGPIPGEQVPDSLRRVNDVLAAQAAERGVAFVDAIGLGWRTGDPALPDRLAQELARALEESTADR